MGPRSGLAYLPTVALQVENVLQGCEGVDVDDVSVDSREHVAPVAEGTLVGREKNPSKESEGCVSLS